MVAWFSFHFSPSVIIFPKPPPSTWPLVTIGHQRDCVLIPASHLQSASFVGVRRDSCSILHKAYRVWGIVNVPHRTIKNMYLSAWGVFVMAKSIGSCNMLRKCELFCCVFRIAPWGTEQKSKQSQIVTSGSAQADVLG